MQANDNLTEIYLVLKSLCIFITVSLGYTHRLIEDKSMKIPLVCSNDQVIQIVTLGTVNLILKFQVGH
jgi:hypothetical protein